MKTGVAERGSCVLGIDLGTSALKVVAVSRDGRVITTARQTYPTISTMEGQAEQDPDDWLNALSMAVKKIRAQLTRRVQIEAVVLTGQMPTLVVVEKHRPVAHAITWQDSRADQWVGTRVNADLRRDIYFKTGVLIDGRYLAPMFQFHYASKQLGATLVLSAKDFLFHALTGLAITDPSTASGYGLYNLRTNAWDPDLSEFWDVTAEQLPPIRSSSFSAPVSKRGCQLLGCAPATPVVLGCADSVAGSYGMSAGSLDSTATIITGSSTVILKSDSEPRWDHQSRYLITPLALDGVYGREADLLASGSAREWAVGVFLRRRGKKKQRSVWQEAYRLAPGADGLFFAPFLAGGEQGVLWNPNLRGTISGLTLAHRSAQIARALLEGTCFEIRRCLEVFEDEMRLSSVRLTGWMADAPQQSQLLADIIGRPVHAFRLDSASAVGAALLSGMIDRKKYLENMRAVVFTPTEQKLRYDELYSKYAAQFPSAK